ncbi:CapA family protein [Flaviflexus equikiangi]|uniref:CapA family protein n=1 Tax=Flaviflexus equikiangi TaxID=2758573 RepID=A0ABS2TEN7_9ACTO|nr:CapA family protein [Flaviflexus equikiangi]MBM9433120.1 CapA family protein [Flaviflexus equikiangi]
MSARKLTASAFLMALLAASCSNAIPDDSASTLDDSGSASAPPVESAAPPAGGDDGSDDATTEAPSTEPIAELTIVSGGDILLHPSIYESARVGADSFDFTYQFEQIKHWIDGADLSLCALEVPIAPEGTEYSGYPMFGAPADLIPSLKEVGFDGCATATNHTMDRGFAGVERTNTVLEENGMGFHGGARTEEESEQVQFYDLEVEDRTVTVAHISATTLTNGIPIRAEQPWSWFVIGELGPYDTSDVVDMAADAREQGADLVVVSMHWGTEYVSEPIDEQLIIADELAESGQVDLVYGNHSHVPEPVTELEGGPRGEGMWVAWSMGNLISGQTIANHGYRVTTGYLGTATVDVPAEGPATVSSLDWTVITQDAPGGNRLYVLNEVMFDRPAALTLGQAELQARGDVTYPVMEGNGSSERTDAPVRQVESVTPWR